jgi:hypothetical protein
VILTINSQEVQAILEAIDILLEIKCLIRNIAPSYQLNATQLKLFDSLLNSLKNQIEPLFSKYIPSNLNGTTERKNNEILLKLKKLIESERYILISASHSKKILKNVGFNPLNIIVSGGPLILKDYLKVNPNLSKKILQGIKRKTINTFNKLKNIAKAGSKITFIYIEKNETDQIILEELSEIKDIIGKDIDLFEIPNWKMLEV